MNKTQVKLQFLLPSLPRAEKKLAEYMQKNMGQIADMTLAVLSQETGVSEATVLRLCKRLGFTNFIQLRQAFALASIEEEDAELPEIVTEQDNMKAICSKTIQGIIRTLENTQLLMTDEYEIALQKILNAKNIYLFAAGDALSSCNYAHAKFSRLGLHTVVCSDVVYQYETALRMTKEDVAIAISSSGRSQNVVNSVKLAKEQGGFVICITQTGRSPLVKYSDISLFISSIDTTIGRDSVNRRVAELVIIDSFYQGIIFSNRAYYKELLYYTMQSSEINKI